MKKLLFALCILTSITCFGQKELYKFGLEPLQSEQEIREKLIKNTASLPDGYTIQPTIKHKYVDGEWVIKIIEFRAMRTKDKVDPASVEFVFKQDSCLLNLGKALPAFSLEDHNIKQFSSSSLKGKPILLFFWAPQIPQSLEQFPLLDKMAVKYTDRINIVTITHENCDISYFDDLMVYENLQTHLIDRGSEFHDNLKIYGYPMFVFVDGKGIIKEFQRFMPQKKDEESGKYLFDSEPFEQVIQDLLNIDN